MKKKCLSLILGIMLVLSLGSCGKESVTTSGCAEQEMVKDDTTSSTPKVKREDCPVVMRSEETPVPIPNTTVKIRPADDTTTEGCGKAGGCRAFFFILYRPGL